MYSPLPQYYDNGCLKESTYYEQAEYSTNKNEYDISSNPLVNVDVNNIKKNEDGKFYCVFCPTGFKYRSLLKQHMMKHTGEKPFACTYCSYRGQQKNHLDKHVLTHTGEKPYQCPECPFRGAQKNHIDRHMLTHTGLKPYHSCNFCSYRTTSSNLMENHMKKHCV